MIRTKLIYNDSGDKLDNQINLFLETANITSNELIDIKYQSVDSDNHETIDSALIIFQIN